MGGAPPLSTPLMKEGTLQTPFKGAEGGELGREGALATLTVFLSDRSLFSAAMQVFLASFS